jgi:polar amino acid transport system substrate-binding protein
MKAQARHGWRCLLLLVGCCTLTVAVQARALVMAVDNATEMPMARIEGNRVMAGMSYELGQLIGRRLGQEVVFVPLPRRRLVDSLLRGEADLVCTYMPEWLSGPLRWSRPFFRQEEALLTRLDAPAPRRLADLRGQPIGTVQGFVYPELLAVLGPDFVREDAPTAAANLRKLAAGRMNHASSSVRVLRYMQRTAGLQLAVHPPWVLSQYKTHCALSPMAPLTLEDLNRAIAGIERDGSLEALYKRYD